MLARDSAISGTDLQMLCPTVRRFRTMFSRITVTQPRNKVGGQSSGIVNWLPWQPVTVVITRSHEVVSSDEMVVEGEEGDHHDR